MKVRVFDSDGIFKGGLFKTDCHNAMNCRMWPAPPHPNYRESLIDIAGQRNPCEEDSWFRLLLSEHPDISGPPDGSDAFDANSKAIRITPEQAAGWLKRHHYDIPADLAAMLTRRSIATHEDTSTDTVSAPLPDGTAEVWNILNGHVFSAKEIARKLHSTEDAIRKRIARLREAGYRVQSRRGAGYFRPDAPPLSN